MKHEVLSPITDENFKKAWDYANCKLIEIQKKKLIRKILVLVANSIFLICATIITLNVIMHLSIDGISLLFDKLGPIKALVFASNKVKSLDIDKLLNELEIESVEESTDTFSSY